jgi:hypothetical protein
MVTVPVSTSVLVTAYKFLASYEILKLAGGASVVGIVARIITLPRPARPPLGERHAPYVRALAARQRTIILGVALILLTVAMLWAHFRIPEDVEKMTAASPNLEEVRPKLVTFFMLLVPIPLLHFWFWSRIYRIASVKTG